MGNSIHCVGSGDDRERPVLEDIGARMKTSKNQNMADLVVAVTTSPYFGYTSVQ